MLELGQGAAAETCLPFLLSLPPSTTRSTHGRFRLALEQDENEDQG